MHWLEYYQLFLFDLDGLLVNTEEIHFRAYKKMLKDRGFSLPWDFATYFSIAQQDAKAPELHIYREFPQLKEKEPNWAVLYSEKKRAYLEILAKEPAPLLPGATEMLQLLQQENKKRCVVTHSQRELVLLLRKQNPLLNTIEHWFTREDYTNPKPSPDGYIKAIDTLASPNDNIIGFEDSDRGLRALMATRATPILINSLCNTTRSHFENLGVTTFLSLHDFIHTMHKIQ